MSNQNDKKQNVRLTSKTVAEYCQVSRSTVLAWIKSGQLEAFSLPSGHHRIDKEDFRVFLEKWNMPIKEWLFGYDSKREECED